MLFHFHGKRNGNSQPFALLRGVVFQMEGMPYRHMATVSYGVRSHQRRGKAFSSYARPSLLGIADLPGEL
jgi:hypothetical protein